jgi:hypothetical protein
MKLTILNLYQIYPALARLDIGLPGDTPQNPSKPFDLGGKDLYALGRNMRLIRQELAHFEEKRAELQKPFLPKSSPEPGVKVVLTPEETAKRDAVNAKVEEMAKAEVDLDLRPFTLAGLGLDQSPARNKIPAQECLSVLIEHALLEEPK